MFLFMSLLASSLDGFISGFILKTTGIDFKKEDYIKIFITISACCLLASIIGNDFSKSNISSYINIFGAIIMLYLALSAFKSIGEANNFTNPFAIAFSLAADASIVCMYLGMTEHNIFKISVMSGAMHTFLMTFGSFLSGSILGNKFSKIAKITAGLIFLTMALIKVRAVI